MIRALVFMLGCNGGLSSSEKADGGVAIAAAPTLRNCLKIAGGLKDSGDGAAASAQVLSCYDDHFLPMLPIVRDQNRRAALSLEYGFGLLAHSMTQRRSDTTVRAEQLADRVDAVVASINLPADPIEQ